MPRIIILDPSLCGEKSHHLNMASALLREASLLGAPCQMFCHRSASEIIKQLPASPLFQVGGYDGSSPDVQEDCRNAAAANVKTLFDLQRLEGVRPDDFVLFPTVTANMILAICKWVAGFAPTRAPAVGMCLMFPPDWPSCGESTSSRESFYRDAFSFLTPSHKKRMVFTCETQGLADIYARLLDVMPCVLPVPVLQHTDPPRSFSVPDIPTVTAVGYAKPEKGTHLLPDVIAAVRERVPRLHVIIHMMSDFDRFVGAVRSQLAAHSDIVTLIEGALNAGDYHELIRKSNLLLLPYDPRNYRNRGSGVFLEAKAMGIPVVVPGDTDMGREGEAKGLAVTFEEFTAPSVADAVLTALQRLPQLSNAAYQEADRLQQDQRGYLRPLLRHVECH